MFRFFVLDYIIYYYFKYVSIEIFVAKMEVIEKVKVRRQEMHKRVTWAPGLRNTDKKRVTHQGMDIEMEDVNLSIDNIGEDIDENDGKNVKDKYTFWKTEEFFSTMENMPFHVTRMGNVDLLERLIQEDVENCLVTAQDSQGKTLLHYAAGFGHEKIVTLLLQKGACVNACDNDECSTPLICAAAYGSLPCLQILLSSGADVNFSINTNSRRYRTALHWAVVSGSLDCVKALVFAGAIQQYSQEPAAVTPFLISAELGRAEIMRFLLDNGASIHDVEGQTYNSALHLAAKNGSQKCIKILLATQADISPLEIRNYNGETPLHLTSCKEAAHFLLSKGANPNATDVMGNTPLHRHVQRGNEGFAVVQALLCHSETKINARDNESNTPLHKAILAGSSRLACYLLGHGANVTIKNNQKMNPFSLIKLKMPHIIPNIKESLDSSIKLTQNDPADLECTVSLDFSSIGMNFDLMKLRHRNSRFLGGKDFPDLKLKPEVIRSHSLRLETRFLNDLITDGYKELLSHPLIDAFLELKWKKTRVIFLLSFTFHFLLTSIFTLYTMETFMRACPFDCRPILCQNQSESNPSDMTASSNTTANTTDDIIRLTTFSLDTTTIKPRFEWTWFNLNLKTFKHQSENKRIGDKGQIEGCNSDVTTAVVVSWSLVIIGIIINIMKEILKLIQGPKIYFTQFENLGQWALTITVIMSLLWNGYLPYNCCQIFPFQYPTAAVGLLITWTMILVRIGRFPHLGLYVQMFGKVLKNFGGFIFVYLSLISAFALAFCVLFPGEPSFSSFPLSMLKVFTMMTGEVDYEELFYGPRDERAKRKEKALKENLETGVKEIQFIQHPIVSHFLYGAFVLIVTVVLMNLLVGLAVSDIQCLEKWAAIDRLGRQTRCIFQLENFVFAKSFTACLPNCIMDRLKNQILLQPETQMAHFIVKPNDPRDISISETLKAKVMTIALRQRDHMLDPEFHNRLHLGVNRHSVNNILNKGKCQPEANTYLDGGKNWKDCKDPKEEGLDLSTDRLTKIEELDAKLNNIQAQLDQISKALMEKIQGSER